MSGVLGMEELDYHAVVSDDRFGLGLTEPTRVRWAVPVEIGRNRGLLPQLRVPKALQEVSREPASRNNIRIRFEILQGIQKEEAKLINVEIKKSKLKVKSQIQGDELRVSGPKRDDLQKVIQLIKALPLKIPAQFVNFRD